MSGFPIPEISACLEGIPEDNMHEDALTMDNWERGVNTLKTQLRFSRNK